METRSEFRPHIIRAGAGTGKTFSLIEKIFRLIDEFERLDKGRKPRLIVSTFTKKAAAELSERLSQKAFAGGGSADLTRYIHSPGLFVSTLHGLFSSFLKTCGCQIAVPSDWTMISDEDEKDTAKPAAFRLLQEQYPDLLHRMSFHHLNSCLQFYCKQRMRRGGKPLSFYDERDFEGFPALLEQESPKLGSAQRKRAKEGLFAGDFVPVFQKFQKAAEDFFPLFEKEKKRRGLFTPDDFEGLLKTVLAKKGAARRIADDWDYWLIDEYQDISRVQEEILQTLTRFQNVFCVGDPGQSIYLFRNADPDVFRRRVTAFKEACGEEPEELIENRRSRPELIAFFNELFAEKSGFLRLKAAPSDDSAVSSQELAPPASVENAGAAGASASVEGARPAPASAGTDAAPPPVHFIPFSSKESAFEGLYRHIQRLLLQKKRPEEDIAVLSNKNETLKELSLFLEKRRVPAVFSGSGLFLRNRAVLDALFLLKFLADPFDDGNLISLLRAPLFRVSDKTLTSFCKRYREGRLQNGSHAPPPPPQSEAARPSVGGGGGGEEKARSLWAYILQTEEGGGGPDVAQAAEDEAGEAESEIKEMTRVLLSCLDLKKQRGLIFAFSKIVEALFLRESASVPASEEEKEEAAVLNSESFAPASGLRGIARPFSDQDKAALWKMLQCLHERQKARENPLNFYYDFLNKRLNEKEKAEPPLETGASFQNIRLLTVHGAKGLEFHHVIVLNLSKKNPFLKMK